MTTGSYKTKLGEDKWKPKYGNENPRSVGRTGSGPKARRGDRLAHIQETSKHVGPPSGSRYDVLDELDEEADKEELVAALKLKLQVYKNLGRGKRLGPHRSSIMSPV